MARLPIVTRATTDEPGLRKLLEELDGMHLEKFANQFGVLAHHPALAEAMLGLLRAYYYESVVPRRYLELAILLVSAHNRCGYCVIHHAPPALEAGLSPAQLASLEDGSWATGALFDAVEQAVLKYVDQLSRRGGRIDESAFEALREHFDEKQVVELTVRAGMCEFFNRFNEAFQVDVEPVAEALYRTHVREDGATRDER